MVARGGIPTVKNLRYIDIPPVWLAIFAALGYLQSIYLTFGLGFDSAIIDLFAGLCIGAGMILIVLAAVEMRKARTTIIPHQDANVLVTNGIFKRTRNPIYLGDGLILLGLLLKWDAIAGLILVPLFFMFIEKRFIVAEENRLRRLFRADFARYMQKTRRWI